MPRLLLNLRNVPADEAEEVRALMAEHAIVIYDTPPGPFGITAGGIWLRHEDDHPRAKALLDDYQLERARRAREAYEAARREGRAETLWTRIRRHPVKFLFHLLLAIFILMVFFAPLIELSRVRG